MASTHSFDFAQPFHKGRHAADGPDPITPADIGAAEEAHTHSWGQVTGKPSTFPPAAHTHTPDEAGAVPATRWLTGTGSPEGTRTAPVGTVYTDGDATFGAIEWVKATGTGSTGWRVTKGDTGRVDITSTASTAATPLVAGDTVEVQRTPHHVLVWVSLVASSGRGGTLFASLPTWARPAAHRSVAVSVGGSTPSGMVLANDTLTLRAYSLTSQAALIEGLTLPLSPNATPWRTS